ncbi:MAG TPA: hypothetical protein VIF62_30770 [Labilithrix sp.]
MKRLALAALFAACAGPRSPSNAPASTELAWIASPKLDADVKEFLLRAHDEDLVFPFRLTTRGAGLEPDAMERLRAIGIAPDWSGDGGLLHCKPAQVGMLVAEPDVEAVACDTPVLSISWEARPVHQANVDPDVNVIMAARSRCWIDVLLRFRIPATTQTRTELEQLGGVVKTFDATSSIVWMPVQNLLQITAWIEVDAIERAPRP